MQYPWLDKNIHATLQTGSDPGYAENVTLLWFLRKHFKQYSVIRNEPQSVFMFAEIAIRDQSVIL